MEVIFNKQESTLTVQIKDRIDTPDAKGLETDIKSQISPEIKDLIIDCSELTYVSSSGLRVFFGVKKALTEQKSKLSITNISDNIKEIFDLTGFTTLLGL